VTHQRHVEPLVGAAGLPFVLPGRRMHPGLAGPGPEDQPATPGVDGRELEDVAEEVAGGVGVLGVQERVDGGDHPVTLLPGGDGWVASMSARDPIELWDDEAATFDEAADHGLR